MNNLWPENLFPDILLSVLRPNSLLEEGDAKVLHFILNGNQRKVISFNDNPVTWSA